MLRSKVVLSPGPGDVHLITVVIVGPRGRPDAVAAAGSRWNELRGHGAGVAPGCKPLGGVVTWVWGPSPIAGPCCHGARRGGPGSGAQTGFRQTGEVDGRERPPSAAAVADAGAQGLQGEARMGNWQPEAFAPSWACMAAALISARRWDRPSLPPPSGGKDCLLQSGYGALSGAPLVESVRNAIEHGLHGRRQQNRRRPRDANSLPAGLRNSAPRGGKVRRSENSPPHGLGDSSARTASIVPHGRWPP